MISTKQIIVLISVEFCGLLKKRKLGYVSASLNNVNTINAQVLSFSLEYQRGGDALEN